MIRVSDIIELCGGKLICGDIHQKLENFCIDSRKVEKGDVYVGLKGEKVDGSDYYLNAIENGASVCILDKEYGENTYGDATIVVVEDTLKCIQELAREVRRRFKGYVVAITGSVGKTSCKDLIASVLETKYLVHKTSGNYNNHIGVPLTILSLKEDDEILVVEMGMNHLGEIHLLSSIAMPDVAVITNVGTAHIGNLGSRENILKAKLEILDGLKGNQVVLNGDNDMLSSVVPKLKNKYEVRVISIDEDSENQAKIINSDAFSSCFDIINKCSSVLVNVGGKAYVYNALMAYAVGKIFEISDELIKKGISHFHLSSHRLEKKISKSGITIIDDTYNANYDSMVSSLNLLGQIKDKRRIAILGDMLELGEYGERLHYDLGDAVIYNKIDKLITVGELSCEIDKRVIELGMKKEDVYHFSSEEECYSLLKDLVREDDIILVKGSHGIHLVNVVDDLVNL